MSSYFLFMAAVGGGRGGGGGKISVTKECKECGGEVSKTNAFIFIVQAKIYKSFKSLLRTLSIKTPVYYDGMYVHDE